MAETSKSDQLCCSSGLKFLSFRFPDDQTSLWYLFIWLFCSHPGVPTITMAIPPRSMTVIDSEFQHLKGIREICFDEDVMAFLHDAQATLKYQGIYNQRGPFKRSLIHYAAMGDCAELLLYLLQDGTAKDDLDQNRRTPLSWAAQYSALRAVKLLLDNGAEINSMDNMYTTPLSWLVQAGRGPNRAATMNYLRSNGATRRGATRASIKRKIIQVFPSGLL
ncbi:unnamed protein product [Penicillium nalgiovense]|uniref:Uncharacterized protein n=2 Tax=Penicillium nalgiovense TaxID=60175 RepID=A0A9W4HT39_PENNA|nr:unnamed protein product [Penicillium nalgiovense]CAG8037836.1 unnamed protein product [Penicillium nalgiovense]CAG8039028.1 unnamed protein product [Penicillium nalgiovense]CAG8069292.1 unnamed protein product [Penicillium nalgiovense]CAG8082075.1 unnamed protein product [Penicillium nalgiovense]